MVHVTTILQAIDILINAAHIAQSNGAFELDEARLVAEAIDILTDNNEDNNTNNEQTNYDSSTNQIELTYNEKASSQYVDDTIPQQRTNADIIAKQQNNKKLS